MAKRSDNRKKAPPRGLRPGLARRTMRFVKDHPKGVLIFAASLLGLIVVFQNLRMTTAFLLVTEVKLPFMVWGLIFCLIGYLTGKWVEWAITKRRIMKGTYKAKLSAEELKETSKSLDGRLHKDPDAERDAGDAPVDDEDFEPETMFDRRSQRARKAPESRYEDEREPPRRAPRSDGHYDERYRDEAPRRGRGDSYYDDHYEGEHRERRPRRDDYYDDPAPRRRARGREDYYEDEPPRRRDDPYDDRDRPRRRDDYDRDPPGR